MTRKPRLATEYAAHDIELVRAVTLTVARVLGSYLEELTVIGGLVPNLLVPQGDLAPETRHVGTTDLDLVLQLGLLEEGRYKEVSELLRRSGFEPEKKQGTGAVRSQRWIAPGTDGKGIIEFLVPPISEDSRGGKLQHMENDFAAFVLPGGHLAFRDRVSVEIAGKDLRGARASRSIWVCGPAAFLILKAFAHAKREEPKDAYDIWYLLRFFPDGGKAIAKGFESLRDDPDVKTGLGILEDAFKDLDASGSLDVAFFLGSPEDDALRQDVSAFVMSFLAKLTA